MPISSYLLFSCDQVDHGAGVVDFNAIKDLFLSSQLNQNTLGKIWTVCARMHVVGNQTVQGFDLVGFQQALRMIAIGRSFLATHLRRIPTNHGFTFLLTNFITPPCSAK